MEAHHRHTLFSLFIGISFFAVTCHFAYSEPPPLDIREYVEEYHTLNQKRKEEIRKSEELDRQSREAMANGDASKALSLLKQAIAILKSVPHKAVGETVEMDSTTDSPFGLQPAVVVPPFEYGIINPYDFAVDLGANWDRSLIFIWTLAQPDLAKEEFLWPQDRQLRDVPQSMNLVANILIGDPEIDAKYYNYAKEKSFLPKNIPAYRRFIKALVERYDGDGIDDMPDLRKPIKYWQVDNEPPHGLRDYPEFLKITYLAIKEADPEAKVIIGGVQGMPPVSTYLKGFDTFYLPILDELEKLDGNYFDIFDFHWYGNATGDYLGVRTVYEYIKKKIDKRGLSPTGGYWITEMGTYSGDPLPVPILRNYDYPFQTEEQQAEDLFKRYIYPLSIGIKKVFSGFGIKEGFKYDEGFFDFTGLIYDGRLSHDRGKGLKKLAYYTYQLMTQKFQGVDWDNIATISDGKENIYAFKFTKKGTGKVLYAAWWDYFAEKGYKKGDTKNWCLPADVQLAEITSCVTNMSGTRESWKAKGSPNKIEILLKESPLVIEPMN